MPTAPSSTPSSAPPRASPQVARTTASLSWTDNLNPDATIAHAVILLNGLCATNTRLLANDAATSSSAPSAASSASTTPRSTSALSRTARPAARKAGPSCIRSAESAALRGGECIPDPTILRYDDIAALNRIYPSPRQISASFPGKQLTAASTISIHGTIAFRTGTGMQGVNVVAGPLDANGNPLYQYTVTAVSGALYSGNHGNAVTGLE